MREIIFVVIFILFKETGSDSDGRVCDLELSCSDEELITYLANIQVINPESIVQLAVEDFEPLCRKIKENLHDIHNYLKTCRRPDESNLYMSLIEGVKVLHIKLCTTPEVYEKFEVYYPCLHELRNDFEGCNGPADWYEDSDRDCMCKAYKNIIDCYYIKCAKVCGKKAAQLVKDLVKDVVDTIIKVPCSGISKNPYVNDPMPETYIAKSETTHNDIKVTMFTIFIISCMNL